MNSVDYILNLACMISSTIAATAAEILLCEFAAN